MFTEARQPFPASFLLFTVVAFGMICAQKTGGAEPAGVRTWTEAESQRTIDAEFVELRNGNVCLKRTDGKIFELDPSRLSAADREYVQALTGSRTDAAATAPGEGGPYEATKITADADAQVVIAEGVGTNPEEALREAFRQAVRQVVGTFVDAETLVKNDELVSDKILTYSNGYITAFKKLSETERNGLARVTIQAAVKREPLAAKLSEVNVTVAPLPGSKLFAQAVSQTSAEKDALALLRSALVGFPHNLIEATSEGEPRIEERSDEKVTISYEVKIAANIEKYTPFQQRLTQVLERIAKYKGESTLMRNTDIRSTGDYLRSLQGWASYAFGTRMSDSLGAAVRGRAIEAKPPSFEAASHFSGPLWPGDGRVWQSQNLPLPLDVKTDFGVVVNTGRTRMHDRTTWKWFCVPRAAVAPPSEFARLGYGEYVQGKHDVCPDQARIQVEFLDGKGIAVAADEIFISQSAPGSRVILTTGDTVIQECSWVISPYIVVGNVYARSVSVPRRLELRLDTLAEVESVRCTVTGP